MRKNKSYLVFDKSLTRQFSKYCLILHYFPIPAEVGCFRKAPFFAWIAGFMCFQGNIQPVAECR